MAAFHSKPERLRDAPGEGTARDAKDRYETPPEVTDALLDRFGHRLGGLGTGGDFQVIDPCCGTKRITRQLLKRGYIADGCDIQEDGVDFLSDASVDWLDGIADGNVQACVTNPPFSHAEQFVRRALELFDGPVAMLLPSDFLWSGGRRDWLDGPGRPQHILVVPWRIKFFRRDGTRIPGQAYSHQWCLWTERAYRPSAQTLTHWARVPDASVRRSK